jgi:hypothetical protein
LDDGGAVEELIANVETQITALSSELSFWKMVKSCTKNNSNKADYKQAQVGT